MYYISMFKLENFFKAIKPKQLVQDGGGSASVEVPKPTTHDNAPKSPERIKYGLDQRYADARLNLSGQKLLDEIFDISNEYKAAGMLKEAGDMLIKAEEIESGKTFEQESDKELDLIAGTYAKVLREASSQVTVPEKQN